MKWFRRKVFISIEQGNRQRWRWFAFQKTPDITGAAMVAQSPVFGFDTAEEAIGSVQSLLRAWRLDIHIKEE